MVMTTSTTAVVYPQMSIFILVSAFLQNSQQILQLIFFSTHFWFEVKMIKTTTYSMILPHVVVKKPEKSGERVGLIKICFYTQYKTVLLDRLFLLDIFYIPLRCNRTEMREIIQCTSFVLINGTVTFIHF